MFKRQILLLALLEEFGGNLPPIEMMKYLFLLTRIQKSPAYHFVPYRYGCFSFTAYADKRKMIEKGILNDSQNWSFIHRRDNYYMMLSPEDRSLIKLTKKRFSHLKENELIRFIYLKYPFFARNSHILSQVLNQSEISKITGDIPQKISNALYSIGYEGRSIEEYINCLIEEDVKILCDVRKNPISRKYGFSKTTLKNALENINIKYKHFPELGIEGDKRKNLDTYDDYIRLFDLYEKEVLDNNRSALEQIHRMIQEKERVGLICFERLPQYCHRTRIARAILKIFDRDLTIVDL